VAAPGRRPAPLANTTAATAGVGVSVSVGVEGWAGVALGVVMGVDVGADVGADVGTAVKVSVGIGVSAPGEQPKVPSRSTASMARMIVLFFLSVDVFMIVFPPVDLGGWSAAWFHSHFLFSPCQGVET